MHTYIADADSDFRKQLAKFCEKYPEYKDVLKIDTDIIDKLNAANLMVQFIFNQQDDLITVGKAFTSYKNLLRSGNSDDVLGKFPVLSAYPTVQPPLCDANAEGLLRAVVQACVSTKKLTNDMGIALGIVKATQPATDLTASTPILTAKYVTGGHPLLNCMIGDYEGYEIWKDTGKGYVFFNVSSSPSFIDKSPLPAFGISEIWNYKIIYRYKNEQIANWSEVVSITVKGSI